jgi:hypothetical protein
VLSAILLLKVPHTQHSTSYVPPFATHSTQARLRVSLSHTISWSRRALGATHASCSSAIRPGHKSVVRKWIMSHVYSFSLSPYGWEERETEVVRTTETEPSQVQKPELLLVFGKGSHGLGSWSSSRCSKYPHMRVLYVFPLPYRQLSEPAATQVQMRLLKLSIVKSSHL